MIVEVATVTRRDGTTSRFGREKGGKLFTDLDPVGAKLGLGYSRRRLEERPQMDRGIAGVSFEKGGGD